MIFQKSAFPDCSTLANFLDWAGNTSTNPNAPGTFHGISFAISSFGWTQTADTGQVNWNTIAAVPSNPTLVYEVWKMADSLSGAFPVYLKILYGQSAAGAPNIQIQFGTGGTDGAGNFNAPHSVQIFVAPYTNGAQTLNKLNMWFSGDSGSFRWYIFTGRTDNNNFRMPIIFAMSRLNDASGNRIGTGVVNWTFDYHNASGVADTQLVWNATIGGGGIRETGFFIGALPQQNQGTSLQGALLLTPAFVNVGGLSNPTPDLFFGKNADFNIDEAIQQFPVYGTQHTYITASNQQQGPQFINQTSSIQTAALIRYE